MRNTVNRKKNANFLYSKLPKDDLNVIEKAKELLKPITEKYKIDLATLFKSIPDSIPISIFTTKLTPLEAIVKYLKEEKSLSLSIIAGFLNRDERNIWHIYNDAKKKYPQKFVIKTDKITIPLSIFSNSKLSALETIVSYLKENFSLTYHEIAVLLNRDERTVWTVYQRAKKKDIIKGIKTLNNLSNFLQEEKILIEKVKELLKPITSKYNLELDDLFKDIKENTVSVSIFLNELTVLESIVKYLKEERDFSLRIISKIIGRDEKNVWHIYDNTKKKYPERLIINDTKIQIPISIFSNSKLSALESLVVYLKEKSSLTFHEIAVLLHRDDSTIWTVYQRTRNKNDK